MKKRTILLATLIPLAAVSIAGISTFLASCASTVKTEQKVQEVSANEATKVLNYLNDNYNPGLVSTNEQISLETQISQILENAKKELTFAISKFKDEDTRGKLKFSDFEVEVNDNDLEQGIIQIIFFDKNNPSHKIIKTIKFRMTYIQAVNLVLKQVSVYLNQSQIISSSLLPSQQNKAVLDKLNEVIDTEIKNLNLVKHNFNLSLNDFKILINSDDDNGTLDVLVSLANNDTKQVKKDFRNLLTNEQEINKANKKATEWVISQLKTKADSFKIDSTKLASTVINNLEVWVNQELETLINTSKNQFRLNTLTTNNFYVTVSADDSNGTIDFLVVSKNFPNENFEFNYSEFLTSQQKIDNDTTTVVKQVLTKIESLINSFSFNRKELASENYANVLESVQNSLTTLISSTLEDYTDVNLNTSMFNLKIQPNDATGSLTITVSYKNNSSLKTVLEINGFLTQQEKLEQINQNISVQTLNQLSEYLNNLSTNNKVLASTQIEIVKTEVQNKLETLLAAQKRINSEATINTSNFTISVTSNDESGLLNIQVNSSDSNVENLSVSLLGYLTQTEYMNQQNNKAISEIISILQSDLNNIVSNNSVLASQEVSNIKEKINDYLRTAIISVTSQINNSNLNINDFEIVVNSDDDAGIINISISSKTNSSESVTRQIKNFKKVVIIPEPIVKSTPTIKVTPEPDKKSEPISNSPVTKSITSDNNKEEKQIESTSNKQEKKTNNLIPTYHGSLPTTEIDGQKYIVVPKDYYAKSYSLDEKVYIRRNELNENIKNKTASPEEIISARLYDIFDEIFRNLDILTDPPLILFDWLDGTSFTDMDALELGFKTFWYDHAEIYWLSGANKYYSATSKNLMAFKINALNLSQYNNNEFEYYAQKMLNFVPENVSEYETAKILHDVIIDNTSYNFGKDKKDFNAYGPIVHGLGVCDGYSRAYQYLLQRKGIPAVTVTGKAARNMGDHAWVMVGLNNETTGKVTYYFTDVLWDEINAYTPRIPSNGLKSYKNFMTDQQDLIHKLDETSKNIAKNKVASNDKSKRYYGPTHSNYKVARDWKNS